MTKQEKANKCLQLVKEGKTYREIGEILGFSRTYVYILLKEMHREEVRAIHKSNDYYWLKKRSRKQVQTTNCKNCNKELEYIYRKPKFCNHTCLGQYMRKAFAEYDKK